jgi:hypothetical protein
MQVSALIDLIRCMGGTVNTTGNLQRNGRTRLSKATALNTVMHANSAALDCGLATVGGCFIKILNKNCNTFKGKVLLDCYYGKL